MHPRSCAPVGYTDLLGELKNQVRAARTAALRTVNTQLIELYWSIGRAILERQEVERWGSGVIGRLADDLRAQFPEMKGLSRSNRFYMRGFAAAWPDSIVQQPVGQLPWGHITVLLDKLDRPDDRTKRWGAPGRHPRTLSNGLLDQTRNSHSKSPKTPTTSSSWACPAKWLSATWRTP
ncbi:DUF1016 N-terminal domain-containing protein [Arthrobacter sp. R4-81]